LISRDAADLASVSLWPSRRQELRFFVPLTQSQEAPDTAVAVHIRMDIDENEMPEHYADRRVRLFAQKAEERRHGVPHRVPVQRHTHRLADMDLAVAIAREIGGLSRPTVTLGANSFR
jgi:hypothetical protein